MSIDSLKSGSEVSFDFEPSEDETDDNKKASNDVNNKCFFFCCVTFHPCCMA